MPEFGHGRWGLPGQQWGITGYECDRMSRFEGIEVLQTAHRATEINEAYRTTVLMCETV